MLTISLLDSARTATARRVTLSPSDLCASLMEYQTRPHKDGPAWSPIVWRGDVRSAENAESVSALVYDLDWQPHESPRLLGALGERLEARGWRYAIHETFTHGRYRLALPLSRPLSPSEYAGAWEGARTALALEADPSGRDLARLFYLPSHPPGESREAGEGGLACLDPSALPPTANPLESLAFSSGGAVRPGPPSPPRGIPPHPPPPGHPAPGEPGEKSPPETLGKFFGKILNPKISENFLTFDLESFRTQAAKAPKGDTRRDLLSLLDGTLRLVKGERENRLHALTCAFVTYIDEGSDFEVVREFFGPLIERMEGVGDEGPEYYLGKVHSSWERALATRQRKEAQLQAARSYFQAASADWRKGLKCTVDKDGNPARVKPLSSNIDLILENHPAFRGHIRFNELLRRMEISGGELAAYEGSYDIALMQWLERSEFAIETDKGNCGAALLHHARKHRYNPVRDYLDGLTWDGVHRIERALHRYANAEGNEIYIKDISRKFFIAAAARALDPGCKVDTVLVLQGEQGTRKTTFVQVLSKGWYTTANSRVDDKDMRIQTTESWIVEMSELATVSRGSIEQLRGFITLQKDRIRIPYATYHEDFPRRCVFIGTTNSNQPLIDEDGNRRWWVVSCGRIDAVGLEEDADQLWAEAVHCFRLFEQERAAGVSEDLMRYRWWLTPAEQEISDEENTVYQQENPLELDLRDWWDRQVKENKPLHAMSAMELGKAIRLGNETMHRDPSLLARIAKAVTALGWKKVRRGGRETRYWAYEPPCETK